MRNTIRPILFFLAVGVLSGLGACKSEASGAEPHVVQATDVLELIGTDAAPLILDVRTPGEYAAGHVPGALNIPYDQMATRVEEIRAYQDQGVVLYCRSGRRSGIAAKTLATKGFTNLGVLEGDMPGWERAGHPVER